METKRRKSEVRSKPDSSASTTGRQPDTHTQSDYANLPPGSVVPRGVGQISPVKPDEFPKPTE